MNLVKRSFSDLSKIIFSCSTAESDRGQISIVSFEGRYGYGCQGNGDAKFMIAMIEAVKIAFPSKGIILDLSKLEYSWGDMLQKVFLTALAKESGFEDFLLGEETTKEKSPLAVVISNLNKEGLTSLFVQEMDEETKEFFCNSVEDGIILVSKKIK